MRLIKIRECDGACCKSAPRFPNEDNTNCIYSNNNMCTLIDDPSLIPDIQCPVKPNLTAAEAVQQTCIDWPHNMHDRATGDCCWQWVDD